MNKKARLIAIIGVLLIGLSTDLLAGPVFVHRQNKGLFGYKYILHTPTEQVDRLDCMDPGLKRCRFPKLSNSDYSLNSLNAHLEQVEAAIDNGADSGSLLKQGTKSQLSLGRGNVKVATRYGVSLSFTCSSLVCFCLLSISSFFFTCLMARGNAGLILGDTAERC